jgi:hypothetical protein
MSTPSPKRRVQRAAKKTSPTQTSAASVAQQPRPLLPQAKWMGVIELMNAQIDCYVLDDGRRVLSINGAVRALAGLETGHGRLDKYIGVTALHPYLDAASILGGLIEFEIPGSNFGNGRGLTTDQFQRIMKAFVTAMAAEAPLTRNQVKMAHRCALLLSGLADTGLVALVDEATGYQHNREQDELQVRLKAFIASDLRSWEKTFPDELWEQFGRLTGWKDSLTSRPRYWAKLVIKFIYETLPDGVAEYLKTNRPPRGVMWHQQLTENYGVRMLVTRCIEVTTLARTCRDMQELSDKVALIFGKKPMQFSLSEMMHEERPLALTRRLAKVQKQEAREREIARVIPSYAAGRIGGVPVDADLGTEIGQASLLDLVTTDPPVDAGPPSTGGGVDPVAIWDEPANDGEFETAHERLAVGRSTRRI